MHARPYNGILACDCHVDHGGPSVVCLQSEPISFSALLPALCEVSDTQGAAGQTTGHCHAVLELLDAADALNAGRADGICQAIPDV